MLESHQRLSREIASLLEGIRLEAEGRYACLLDTRRVLFEAPEEPGAALEPLRRRLRERSPALFEIPARMEDEQPMEDLFEEWDQDDFFLAFVNRRVALVLACPDAEPLRERLFDALKALADRLFRLDSSYRLDEKGRGLFLGRARLDMIVVGRAAG